MAAGWPKCLSFQVRLLTAKHQMRPLQKPRHLRSGSLRTGLSTGKATPNSLIFHLLRRDSMVINQSEARSRGAFSYRLEDQTRIKLSQDPLPSRLARCGLRLP